MNAFVAALFLAFMPAAPALAQLCNTPADLAALRDSVLRQVNGERAQAGLPALAASRRLTLATQGHACSLASRERLTHRGRLGGSLRLRLRRLGYMFSMAGENLALGQDTPAQAVAGWMGSPGHRANVLAAGVQDFGLGVAIAGDGRLVWVMVSARPR